MKMIQTGLTGLEFFNSNLWKGLAALNSTRFMSAEFVKRNGDTRRMSFAIRIGKRGTVTGDVLLVGGKASYVFAERAHLSVVDLTLYKSALRYDELDTTNVYRVVNFNTLRWIRVNGYQFNMLDA